MPGPSAAARKPRSCGPTSDRLASGDLIANHRTKELPGIAVRLVVDVIGALHELLRPGLEGEAVGIDDGADGQRLLGD